MTTIHCVWYFTVFTKNSSFSNVIGYDCNSKYKEKGSNNNSNDNPSTQAGVSTRVYWNFTTMGLTSSCILYWSSRAVSLNFRLTLKIHYSYCCLRKWMQANQCKNIYRKEFFHSSLYLVFILRNKKLIIVLKFALCLFRFRFEF